MNAVCELVERIAPYDISVLITGESGTGKELLARAMHYRSRPRRQGLRRRELRRAARHSCSNRNSSATSAARSPAPTKTAVGLFQQADGGTIFLDEIGETSPAFQVKLLRVLQEGEIRPVGGGATAVGGRARRFRHQPRPRGRRACRARFRQDLYYRLSTMTLHVPPLRERPMDIPFISQQVLDKAKLALGKPVKGFTQEAMDCLTAYRWPGNVRELQNEIHRMLALADTPQLGADLLAPRILRTPSVNQQEDAAARADSTLDGWHQGAHGGARGACPQGDVDSPPLEQVAGGE
jgi:two-component system response regulator HupR/HoxA